MLTEVIREATVKTIIAATVEEVESGTCLGWEQQVDRGRDGVGRKSGGLGRGTGVVTDLP